MTGFVSSSLARLALGLLLVVGSARAEAPASGNAQRGATPGSAGAMSNDPSAARQAASPAQPSGQDVERGEVVGRVERIDPSGRLVLSGTEREGLAFDKFTIDDGTQITVGGEKASVTQINEGDQVRASYSGAPNDLHVQRLEVLPTPGAGGANAPGAKSAPAPAPERAREPSSPAQPMPEGNRQAAPDTGPKGGER